ncbi:MAG: adenylyl-sulfate kinase [Pseudomonadota bacterium]|nr:MAG: adenylyl-sulfate kinase [Pseudomonadota bacterium]
MSRGVVIWITGLPSSGKSTFAAHLREQLVTLGVASCVLDSDAVRAALVPAPGYDEIARDHFYDTLARLAALLEAQGLIVVVPATAHRRAYRDRARRRVERWIEVFVDVPPEECRARDAKGLYAASAAGRVSALPGADIGYEPPLAPDVVARGGHDLDAVSRVISQIAETRRPAR